MKSFVEAEVLHSLNTDLSLAIGNAEIFGELLVQYGCVPEATVLEVLDTRGYSDCQRNRVLLQIVESGIMVATSQESARDLFNTLVLILAEPLGCAKIAEVLITSCSKSCLVIVGIG